MRTREIGPAETPPGVFLPGLFAETLVTSGLDISRRHLSPNRFAAEGPRAKQDTDAKVLNGPGTRTRTPTGAFFCEHPSRRVTSSSFLSPTARQAGSFFLTSK